MKLKKIEKVKLIQPFAVFSELLGSSLIAIGKHTFYSSDMNVIYNYKYLDGRLDPCYYSRKYISLGQINLLLIHASLKL
jgi:hypothetical protein